MAIASPIPQEIALYVATSFDEDGGPADWSSNGTYFYATEIDYSGLVRANTENLNNRRRLRAKHKNILTHRNGTCSFAPYWHGKSTHAAEAAAATTFHQSTLCKSALGGEDLGYGIGIASDESEDTDEVQIDSDPGYVLSDFVYVYDTSGTRGEFYWLTAAPDAGPPVTLTLDRDLHFVPDTGGADRIYSVIDCFIDDSVTTDFSNAAHTTLWLRMQGEHAEDVWTAKGCKPQLSIDPIAAGTPCRLKFDCLVTTFAHETETSEDFSAATAQGEAPAVAGLADTCIVKLAAVGSPLVDVDALGSITVNPGVTYTMQEGPNGWEGNHGFSDNGEDTTIEIMVPFDDDYATAYNAGTLYHMLIQVGTGTSAVGIYCPALELGSYPVRGAEGNITSVALQFRALENTASGGALTGANLRKHKSPLHILFVG
jgi:hypothetical protein